MAKANQAVVERVEGRGCVLREFFHNALIHLLAVTDELVADVGRPLHRSPP